MVCNTDSVSNRLYGFNFERRVDPNLESQFKFEEKLNTKIKETHN